MKEILFKLKKEKMELISKIRKIETFRGTDEWNKLSTNHKQLLDIQLSAMRTYLETLMGRCLDIELNMEHEIAPQENNKDSIKQENNEDPIKIVKIIIDN